jgi:preprotein translocase subunit SecY
MVLKERVSKCFRPTQFDVSIANLATVVIQIVVGSLLVIWISSFIDNNGIGNGTSLLIFVNIVTTFLSKVTSLQLDLNSLIQIGFILFFVVLICLSQVARININVISAKQLVYASALEDELTFERGLAELQMKENGLSIRLSQAGIFPIIIVSNGATCYCTLNVIEV